MGSRTLHALPRLTSVHIFRISLPPRTQNILEVNNRDDETAYGAPGIDDTYFRSMHDIDPAMVTDTSMGAGPNSQQNKDSEAMARVRPVSQWSLIMRDNDAHGMPYPYQPLPHNTHSTPPVIPHRGGWQRPAAGNTARLNFMSQRKPELKPEPEIKESQPSATEPFDNYNRELVVRLCPCLLYCIWIVLMLPIPARRSHGTVLAPPFALFSCTRGGCGGVRILLTAGLPGQVNGGCGAMYLG